MDPISYKKAIAESVDSHYCNLKKYVDDEISELNAQLEILKLDTVIWISPSGNYGGELTRKHKPNEVKVKIIEWCWNNGIPVIERTMYMNNIHRADQRDRNAITIYKHNTRIDYLEVRTKEEASRIRLGMKIE